MLKVYSLGRRKKELIKANVSIKISFHVVRTAQRSSHLLAHVEYRQQGFSSTLFFFLAIFSLFRTFSFFFLFLQHIIKIGDFMVVKKDKFSSVLVIKWCAPFKFFFIIWSRRVKSRRPEGIASLCCTRIVEKHCVYNYTLLRRLRRPTALKKYLRGRFLILKRNLMCVCGFEMTKYCAFLIVEITSFFSPSSFSYVLLLLPGFVRATFYSTSVKIYNTK